MRQHVVYLATWLLATVLATAVGFAATTTVGDVLRGAGPVGAEFRPSSSRVADGGGPIRRTTFHVDGVVVIAECAGRTARLLHVAPPPGLTVLDSDVGPDEDVDAELGSGDAVSWAIEIYCTHEGTPRPVVERPGR